MLQLVIPAYNEQARLPRTLRELRRHVLASPALAGAVQVIVVDNASTDATAALARAADSPGLPVRVVHCAVPGKGAAVRAGLLATTSEVVGFMDADGATDLGALEEGLRLITFGADVAIGSRAVAGSDTEARHSRARETGARAYRACTARIVPGVRDTQCGFKLMTGWLGRTVARRLRSTGFAFDVELLALARLHGGRIEEFPVVWTDVPGSTFDPVRHGASSFASLARIAWRVRGSGAPETVPVPLGSAVPAAQSLSAVAADV